jgi:hypothetical protein
MKREAFNTGKEIEAMKRLTLHHFYCPALFVSHQDLWDAAVLRRMGAKARKGKQPPRRRENSKGNLRGDPEPNLRGDPEPNCAENTTKKSAIPRMNITKPVEVSTTRGTTALVYCLINSSLHVYTGTVHRWWSTSNRLDGHQGCSQLSTGLPPELWPRLGGEEV